jgi:hypothetical protein
MLMMNMSTRDVRSIDAAHPSVAALWDLLIELGYRPFCAAARLYADQVARGAAAEGGQ